MVSPARSLLRPISTVQADDVRQYLEKILASAAFRGSKRSQDFLGFVVRETLEGRADALKERTIGASVFGRSPEYQTSEDPIVRVKANEVRKRLAQYYLDAGTKDEVRIEVPPGSYVPEFHHLARPPAGAEPPSAAVEARPRLSRRVWLGSLSLLTVGGIGGYWLRSPRSPIEQFWAPVLDRSEPVLICLAHPVVYYLSHRLHQKYLDSLGQNTQVGPYVLKFREQHLPVSDIIPVPDQYVGVGDAHAAASLAALFASWNKPSRLRVGNDTSFTDLRNAPTVLLGANSNRWTMHMTRGLRFTFERGVGSFYIQEMEEPRRLWKLLQLQENGSTPEDYAVVSRLFDSESGHMVIVAAGLTQYGTQAAGEFLTNPAYLITGLTAAPPDWMHRNAQFVLHTRVIEKAPGPPTVVAAHFW